MRHDRAIWIAERTCASSSKAISDEALIALIAARDKNAMRLLFVRHSARVFRFLLRLVNNAATAEDLVSETFIEIWRQAGRFEARSKASTWILGIARHKGLSSLRQRHVDQLDDDAFALVPDATDDPETNAQNNKRAAVLRDCLRQLPPAQRELLDLIYYHEQSIADVARIIGVPENTVKTRAFHARKRIAKLMAERGIERASL
jgi:RNA polymerase sigma-70 factor, ECF subfamily